MKNRIKKKRSKVSEYLYRNILVQVNGPYSQPGLPVVIHLPVIEVYRPCATKIRRVIDQELGPKGTLGYQNEPNGLGF